MPEYMETTVDKFTFKVAVDRCYSEQGVWALKVGEVVRIGLSDYVQAAQRRCRFCGCPTGWNRAQNR